MLPHCEACERNKDVILSTIKPLLADYPLVLEIGSGTGQHACHFARALPHLNWQPSDCPAYLDGLAARFAAEAPDNILPTAQLDVRDQPWSVTSFPALFTANTLHIMGWPAVEALFAGIGRHLSTPGRAIVYGPFRFNGQFTTESNAAFDQHLRTGNPESGIRDFEAVDELANSAGLTLSHNIDMPANNQCLVWDKIASNPV